jgi:site-specific DNA recombinase
VREKLVIYTRYSSDMQRAESCDDQEREVRRGLGRIGIDHREALVIRDQAESGTKTTRDKFALLQDLVRRGEVAILAVDDQSRLSRAENAFAFIKDLVFARGRFLSTGEGIDTAQDGWELRVQVMELHNSTTIRELGRRVHRGQLGRVLDDGSAGDLPFGYESFLLDSQGAAPRRGPKPKKGVRINEEEARWVRQVFALFVSAKSIAGIARELTRLGVSKGPRATTPGWHHQQVRRMLANPKYVGVWPWGATRRLRSSEGRVKQTPVPPEQQVVRQRPDLRIIDQQTWDKAQQRLKELERVFGMKAGDRPRGPRPHHSEVYPESLLAGLLFCHLCGSRLWMHGSGDRAYMRCALHAKGICAMDGGVPMAKAEQVLLDFVAEMLTGWPPWLESATSGMRSALGEAFRHLPETIRADESRLAEVQRYINNLAQHLEEGKPDSPTLRSRLSQWEGEAGRLRRRITESRQTLEVAVLMPDDDWIRSELAAVPSVLRGEPTWAASVLRRMFGRVTAEHVVARGKVRGFVRLHFRIEARRVLEEALGDRLPAGVLAAAGTAPPGEPMDFHLDLGAPSRRDVLAPEIALMRSRGMTWQAIGKVTRLGTGNAYNVGRRWSDAQSGEHREGA